MPLASAAAPTLVEQHARLFRELNAVLARHSVGAAVRLMVVPEELALGVDELLVQEVDAKQRVVLLRPQHLSELRLGDVPHATQVLDPGDHALNEYAREAQASDCYKKDGSHFYIMAK
ncbi:hypothetical protein ACFY5F_35985 [Streptomyces sp. NPDC013161]|uniref:hypothetical protein n=1 Tax=Streptomyces sp. NPDC013161 TaxID=3364862 RepID=UPI0036B11674